jgi:low temperature requirement protein LtrA
MGWDQSLLDRVFHRLAEGAVPDDVVDLVLAAYVGADQLAAVLSGQPVDLPADLVPGRRPPRAGPPAGSRKGFGYAPPDHLVEPRLPGSGVWYDCCQGDNSGRVGESVVTDNGVRALEQRERPAFLELFFDLVYILALIALANKLINGLSWAAAGQTLILLLAFSLIWALTAWGASTFDVNRPAVQAQIIAVMFGSLVMAAAVPGAFGDRGLIFVAAYLAIHFGSSTLYMFMLPEAPLRRRSGRILFWFTISSPAWIIGSFLGGTAQGVLWAVAIAVEYAAAVLGWPIPRFGRSAALEWRLAGERVAERYRQFFIIALGVAIFVIATTFSADGFTTNRGAAFGVVFVTTVLMWRIYIYRAGELLIIAIATAANPSRFTQFAAVAHLVMVAGVVVTAVTAQLVIERPFGDTPAAWGTVILGGPALFLLGRGLLDYTAFSRVSWSRPVGLVLLAAVAPTVPLLPPIMVAVAATLVLLGIAVSNLIAIWAYPPRPAPPAIG